MELKTVEALLEKYFDAATSIAEEQQLKAYFSSQDVAPHLEQYKTMFGYFKAQADAGEFNKELSLATKVNYRKWISVAASVVLLGGMVTWFNFNEQPQQHELGTYDTPEEAFIQTQKALNMLSKNVNVGVSSMNYIGEYEKTRKTVFKE
jgi:hypothetical protein